jgi:DNA-binding LytR/AlgR family response regulator
MNVLIIEDEIPARAKLVQLLQRSDQTVTILAQLGSVAESIEWLKNNPAPDLAFVDIHLSDDHSFSIFRQFNVEFPVVFTTAYDKYLLESFEYNSIDYLLKPVTEDKLNRSLQKVKKLRDHFLQGTTLDSLINTKKTSRIIARKGTEFIAIECEDLAYFHTEHKIVFVTDHNGRRLIVDYNLSELEHKLDNNTFFRINRKFIVHVKAIEKFRSDNGKILIHLKPAVKDEVHVSKETAPSFRQWMSQASKL